MDNIKNLINEFRLLEQSLGMYYNTLKEMKVKGASESSIESVKGEIREIEYKESLLANAFNYLKGGDITAFSKCLEEFYDKDKESASEGQEMTNRGNKGNFITVHKRKNRKNLIKEYEIPSDVVFVKRNQFIVKFPKEFNIEPYMISSYGENGDYTLSIEVRESFGVYPIIPIKISDMEGKVFDIVVDTIDDSGNVYYSAVYKDCEILDEIIYGYRAYIDDSVRTITVQFSYENIEYIEGNHEAADKEG